MNAIDDKFVRNAQQQPAGPDLDLSFLLRTLWRHRLTIASFSVLGLALAKLLLVITPLTYVASAVLVLEPQPPGVFRTNSVFSSQLIDRAMVESQVEVLGSAQTLTQVIAQLNLLNDPDVQPKTSLLPWQLTTSLLSWLRPSDALGPPDPAPVPPDPIIAKFEELKSQMGVERIGASNAIRIWVKDTSPIKAARLANTVAQIYIRDQLAQRPSGDLNRLPLEDRIIVTKAVPPTKPSGPRRLLMYGGALLLSVMAAVVTILFRRWLDDRVQSARDLSDATNAPCLSTLPQLRGAKATIEPDVQAPGSQHFSTRILDTGGQGRSGPPFADAARKLVLPIREARSPAHDSRVLAITSASRGEGASTIALIMATLLARLSGPTLLIDCDFRGSGLSSSLGAEIRGLTDVLAGHCDATAAYWSSGKDAMTFLPKGHPAESHSADLLGSYQMANFLQEARQHFKHVLLDLPPLLTSIDGRAASSLIDGFVLVVEWRKTRLRDIHRGLEASGPVQAKLIGTVLNKCNLSKMAKSE